MFSLFSHNLSFTRLNSLLAHDQGLISHPDVDSQFVDETDVIKRLLPYHIFHQPKEDLSSTISGRAKANLVEVNLKEEIRGKAPVLTKFSDLLKRGLSLATKSALKCFKRREAIRDRWRKLKIRSGKVRLPRTLPSLSFDAFFVISAQHTMTRRIIWPKSSSTLTVLRMLGLGTNYELLEQKPND